VTDNNALPSAILFATDGTQASRNARVAAAHLARTSGTPLHVVHVWAATGSISGAPGVNEEIAAGVASAEAAVIEGPLGCRVAGIHTPRASRARGILAAAGAVGAGLIVVGGRKLGIVEELFTYRVSEDVVHHSYRPVLLVREDGLDWPPSRVVVGLDGSPEAERALELSGWVARLSKAHLMLVTAVNPDAPGADTARHDAERALAAGASMVRAPGRMDIATRVVTGSDVPKVLREACASSDGTYLLAIGARGSSVNNRAPEFSVSRSVTHHTRLALLLVPAISTTTGHARP
jgi:nucleotide-binding universal stress UspA family protein